MDICRITITSTCRTVPSKQTSGRFSFIVECKNSAKTEALRIAIMAEADAFDTVFPSPGDYVVITDADYYDERRAGCSFGIYAGKENTIHVAAHDDGTIQAEDL